MNTTPKAKTKTDWINTAKRLHDALGQWGIEPIFHGSLCLALHGYNIPINDIDIILRNDQIAAAFDVFRKWGFPVKDGDLNDCVKRGLAHLRGGPFPLDISDGRRLDTMGGAHTYKQHHRYSVKIGKLRCLQLDLALMGRGSVYRRKHMPESDVEPDEVFGFQLPRQVRPATTSRQVVVVLSTGRCASRSLYSLMQGSEYVWPLHDLGHWQVVIEEVARVDPRHTPVVLSSNLAFHAFPSAMENVFGNAWKFIRIIRDGRDWVTSAYNTTKFYRNARWKQGGIRQLADRWVEINQRIIKIEPCYRYENLVSQQRVLDELLIECGADDLVGHCLPRVNHSDLEWFPRPCDWSPCQKQDFNEVAGELMKELNYV